MGMHWTGQGKWLMHDARERRSRRRGARLRWAAANLPWNAHARLWALIVIAGSLLAGALWTVGRSAGWLP